MGRQGDWCNAKGLNNRRKGMYEKESKGRKYCIFALFTLSAIVFIVVGSLHASRSVNAARINADYDEDY